ncbi:MAG: DUF4132 domain-containing protein [Bacteroidota bacterium]
MSAFEVQQVANFTVEFSLNEKNQLATLWLPPPGETSAPDNKATKSPSAFLKKQEPKAVSRITEQAKILRKRISKYKKELDRLYAKNQQWHYPEFEKDWLKDPIRKTLASRVVWQIRSGKDLKALVLSQSGTWHTTDGQQFNFETARIRLWHPVYAEVDEILHWRHFFDELPFQQPIKQAYREVYILTAAELRTQNYSNRMAAHILKHGQLQALARQRGWETPAVIFDQEEATYGLKLGNWGLRATYQILRADDQESNAYAQFVSTNQIRFFRGNRVLDLENVPAVVFSETLRDIDLFVGVSSVGNDPTWQDAGPEGHRDYWQRYSFGELAESAETRKSVLEKLIPKLKIAHKCQIAGRYLKVKGKVREYYKIHMGSSNILMAPDDRYLCIIPDQAVKPAQNLFLPFEGDRTLSLILSKAFMLVEDDKITDETIISQISY